MTEEAIKFFGEPNYYVYAPQGMSRQDIGNSENQKIIQFFKLISKFFNIYENIYFVLNGKKKRNKK